MGIAEIVSLIGLAIQYEPVIAADVVALGTLLFHRQAGTEASVDLEARATAIARRLAAVKEANEL
jgi:hypothetical protein